MTQRDSKSIVKTNFMIATFDAMHYDWFREDHELCEIILEEAVRKKIDAMSSDAIEGIASAIIDGVEIGYDVEKQDFYITD
jgi:hypothetical protein